MNLTPLGYVADMPDKTPLAGIEGCLTTLYPDIRWSGAGNNRTSYQRGKFRGPDGVEVQIKFEGFGEGTDTAPHAGWIGMPVRYEATHDSHITVEEWQGKRNIKVKRAARETWNPPDYGRAPAAPPPQQHRPQQQGGPPPRQSGPPQNAQGGPPPRQQGYQQGGHSGPPAQGPPAQRQTPPRQSGEGGAIPKNGQMVGMCVKMAGDFMIANPTAFPPVTDERFTLELYKLASDFIRVSEKLQDGHIARSPSERAKREAERKASAGQRYERDYAHEPPPNSAQSGQRTGRPDRFPDEDAPPEESQHSGRQLPPAFPEGSDDEIPF